MIARFMKVQEKYRNYNIFIVYDMNITASFHKAYFKMRRWKCWQAVIEHSQDTLKLMEKELAAQQPAPREKEGQLILGR